MTSEEIKKIMRKTYIRWSLDGYTNEMNYLLKIKKNFNTAAWTTKSLNGKKVNVIYIGDIALEIAENFSSKERLLSNMLYHEFGHSKFTNDNFELIEQECKRIYSTFRLWNLFEDVRMEEKVRNLTSHRFNWFNYIKPKYMGVGNHQPEALLLTFKNAEALCSEKNCELVEQEYFKAYLAENEGSEKTEIEINEQSMKIVDKVRNYYYPLIANASDSFSVIPIMKEWLEEFYDIDELKRQQEIENRLKEIAKAIAKEMAKDGLDAKSIPGNGLDGKSQDESEENSSGGSKASIKEFEDLSTSKKLEEKEALDEMNEDTEEVAGNSMASKENHDNAIGYGGDKRDDVQTETVVLDEHTSSDLLQYGQDGELDGKKVAKLLPLFEKFLKSNTQVITSTRPSKRLSIRNMVLNRDKIYKRKDEKAKGQKTISIVVDCSGSMNEVMSEMRIVIAIVNILARKGKVKGNIILSSYEGYQSLQMPIMEQDIKNIEGFSRREGLNNTMKCTLTLLQKSDYIFCLTDGDISDEPIEKDYLAKFNVKPIGIYIGQEAKNLSEWFDKYVNRENAKYTIDEMARKIK